MLAIMLAITLAITLADNFIEHDGSGSRKIQTVKLPTHGNGDHCGSSSQPRGTQPQRLAAHHDGNAIG